MVRLTAYNLATVFFAATGGFTYGYGFGVFVSSVGYPGFYEYFGLDPESEYTASILGAINGLFAFGAAMGALTQGWTSDWLGRKKAIFLSSIISIIGAALVAGSQNVPMIVVCRFIHGLGLGQIASMSPLFIAEISPAHRRGLLIGIFSTCLGLGYTTVAWISFGTFHASDPTLQWRLPLALAVASPLLQSIGVWFVPESPRWLVWQKRKEEAWTVVRRLHHDRDDLSERAANAEYTQVCEQVEYDRQYTASYWHMFKKPSWMKRSLIGMFILFASQSTGVLGIGNYNVLIYQGLGMTGGMPIMMNAVYTMVGTSMVIIGSWVADKIGRRPMLLIGFPVNALFLLGEALLQRQYVGTGNEAGLAACVLFLFLYICAYDIFIDPVAFIYTAEIWPTAIRSKGLALGWFAYFVGAITYTSPSALAFKTIGWHMYLVWFACNIVSTIIVYVFVPETKNITLEEMGDLFGDEVVVHMAQDGRGLVEETGKASGDAVHVEETSKQG